MFNFFKNKKTNQDQDSKINLYDATKINLDDTIQGAIIGKFDELMNNLEYCYSYTDANLEEIKTNKVVSEGFPNLNIEGYGDLLLEMAPQIGYIDAIVKMEREKLTRYEKVLKENFKFLNSNTKYVKYIAGEEYETFYKKNKSDPIFREIPKSTLDDLAECMNEVADQKKAFQNDVLKMKESESVFSIVRYSADEMIKNINFIGDLQAQYKSNQINNEIPAEFINDLVADLLYENINRTRVLKEIKKKEKEIQEKKFQESQAKAKISIQTSNDGVSIQINADKAKDEYVSSKLDTDFFHGIGVNGAILKQICIDEKTYNDAKKFANSLENVLNEAGVKREQFVSLMQKNPGLLLQDKNTKAQYINSVEELYAIMNPNITSGILPTNNAEIYKSDKTLEEFIRRKPEGQRVNVINAEIITNQKDREIFIEKVKANPFEGKAIEKYINRRTNTKTALYKKYSDFAGEGHYRKGKFGSRRAIYKVERIDDVFNVEPITYFTHNEHTEFFAIKK